MMIEEEKRQMFGRKLLGKKMVNGLGGMKMDRRVMKELSRMGKKMEN